MIRVAADWLGTIRSLGDSFLEVLRAELDSLRFDLRASAKSLLHGTRLLVVALILVFWMVGSLVFAAVAFLARQNGLSMWQAALMVATGLLLAAMLMYLWARSTFRRVRSPGQTACEHARQHVAWLKTELVAEDDEGRSVDE